MGVGATAGYALSRINYVLDWSNPLAGVLDDAIKGVLEFVQADELLEMVSGDNELLLERAADWRSAARDLRSTVDDMVAERRILGDSWTGEAADALAKRMSGIEAALLGEADDMDTIAELLEAAAAECALAEELMMMLLVELVEAVLVYLTAGALLSVLTAGASAAISAAISGASVAMRVAKAARITAKLADKLSDLAKRIKAIKKARKLQRELKRLGARGKNDRDAYKNALKGWDGAEDKVKWNGKMSGLPRAAIDRVRGRDFGTPEEYAKYIGHKKSKKYARGLGMGAAGAGDVTELGDPLTEGGSRAADERMQYEERPEGQSLDERLGESPEHRGRTVGDVFG
ncbi:WXG100 family type VII secretion target [Streptomyces sp. NPDC048639]|uniref:WXG100 family type VII secretion target n=1 Tax=Streptomyces sp. NPDC048639 TaxID=3365581 RepID=UPI003722DAA8